MNRQCDEWRKNVCGGGSPMRRRTFIESLCGTAAALSLGGCRFPTGARTDDVRAMLEQDRADGLVRGAVFATAGGIGPEAVGERRPGVPMRTDSLFDIASVSKTFTATAAAMLVADGQIDPDAPFTKYLPEHVLARENCAITVRDLAAHVGGFDGGNASKAGVDTPDYFNQAMRKRPVRPRGERFEYACYNLVLIGFIVERLSGLRLDAFCRDRIFAPLGMSRTQWGPVADDGNVVQVLGAPTIGAISDWMARGAGAPLGNAGVFSTADDLVRFVRDLLTRRTFRPAVYDLLFGIAFEKGGARRSFGFDMSADLRPAGLSDRTIYHSGWTGQTLCIDPETGFGGVLLTARCGDHARAKVRRRDELAALAARNDGVSSWADECRGESKSGQL